MRGGCYEYEATTPYLPFVEAFREWTRRQSPEQLRTALGATASEIAKFAPEIETKLDALVGNAPLPPSEERLRLFDNTARFLRSLAADNGLLLFIDDVHWADQGTLSLLHYLLRHLRDDRVLILAAYREIELDRAHPLASALVEWNRERLATRVVLGRLSHVDTGTLLATLFGIESVSDDFVAALYRETEGNPFFIEEVIKSLIEQGQIYREAGRLGAQGDARARDPAERQGGDRPPADASPARHRRRAAHRRCAREALPVPRARRGIDRGRGRAARCAGRGERRAAHPREHRACEVLAGGDDASRSRTTRFAKS